MNRTARREDHLVNRRPAICRSCGGLVSPGTLIKRVSYQRDDGTWPKGDYYHESVACPNAGKIMDNDTWWKRVSKLNELFKNAQPINPADFPPIITRNVQYAPFTYQPTGTTDPWHPANFNYAASTPASPQPVTADEPDAPPVNEDDEREALETFLQEAKAKIEAQAAKLNITL